MHSIISADRSWEPTLLVTKETKGSETDAGQPSVDRLLIPNLGNSFEYPFVSDMGHHVASAKVAEEIGRRQRSED
jgi:hypothetical protein